MNQEQATFVNPLISFMFTGQFRPYQELGSDNEELAVIRPAMSVDPVTLVHVSYVKYAEEVLDNVLTPACRDLGKSVGVDILKVAVGMAPQSASEQFLSEHPPESFSDDDKASILTTMGLKIVAKHWIDNEEDMLASDFNVSSPITEEAQERILYLVDTAVFDGDFISNLAREMRERQELGEQRINEVGGLTMSITPTFTKLLTGNVDVGCKIITTNDGQSYYVDSDEERTPVSLDAVAAVKMLSGALDEKAIQLNGSIAPDNVDAFMFGLLPAPLVALKNIMAAVAGKGDDDNEKANYFAIVNAEFVTAINDAGIALSLDKLMDDEAINTTLNAALNMLAGSEFDEKVLNSIEKAIEKGRRHLSENEQE